MEVLHFAQVETELGALRTVASARGVVYIELPNASGRGLGGWINTNAPGAKLVEGYAPNRTAVTQLLEYFEGKRRVFDMKLDLRGTAFQIACYDEVKKIGFGETSSYAEIASRMNRPRAVRAVGAANGANPLPIVIPCHRIVASNGKLQGYAGGLEMKARLLALESTTPREGWLL